jgi:phosphatidylglycerol lysyltransferase
MFFLKENRKILMQSIFGLLFIGLVVFFIRNERAEVHQIRLNLRNAVPTLVALGILTSLVYILLQGTLYSFCFRAVNQPVRLAAAIRIYLKRNFVGVFLPAGGISSLAFFTRELEHEKISRNQIHFASSLYAFISLFTVFLIAIPILLIAALKQGISANQVIAFLTLFCLILAVTLVFVLILRRRSFYSLIVRTFPRLEEILQEITDTSINKKAFAGAILISLLIEALGICQLAIAFRALGLSSTLEAAAVGYITAVLFMVISPFLKGLGAIELSTAFILTRFGFTTIESISVTLLFRFFEFWVPLTISGLSFMFVRNNIVLRIIPGVLAFILGIVNMISALTPAIPSRLHSVLEFLPLSAVNLSNYSVFVLGLFLLVVAAFLFKGLRTAWFIAFSFSSVSLVLHLSKAFDYEEALFALFVVMTLWITRKQYFVRSDPKLRQAGAATALISVFAVLIYGITGFYFLDRKYFGMDFNFLQSVQYTLQNFFLFRAGELRSTHAFANNFIYSINVAGFLSMSFLFIHSSGHSYTA